MIWSKASGLFTNLTEHGSAIGVIVTAMGCASCFPAIASLGASVGLGFLSQFEGLFINTLLPIFTVTALATNLFSVWSHRRVARALFGIAGPVMVLATLYLFWTDSWSTYLFYIGLFVMFVASVWDIVSPPRKICDVPNNSSGVLDHEAI